jgi:hypothetical protein
MANQDPQLLAILKKGPEVWNLWRNVHQPTILDLSRADLSGGRFHG